MTSRIPRFQPRSIGDAYRWFAELYVSGLLYHPDDPAETIVLIRDGTRMFDDEESRALNRMINDMFNRFGDRIYEVASIYFRHAIHGVWEWPDTAPDRVA